MQGIASWILSKKDIATVIPKAAFWIPISIMIVLLWELFSPNAFDVRYPMVIPDIRRSKSGIPLWIKRSLIFPFSFRKTIITRKKKKAIANRFKGLSTFSAILGYLLRMPIPKAIGSSVSKAIFPIESRMEKGI